MLGGNKRWPKPLIVILALAVGTLAQAWHRKHYSDSEIVSRAELVVVARLKPDSLTLVPHVRRGGEGASWEHQLQLVISEVLKGSNTSKVITASIGYGLEPIVGGFTSNEFRTIIITNIATYRTGYSKEIVQIFDTGSSAGSYATVGGDIRTNHIWLLRHNATRGDLGLLGIHDPEDLQPIERRAKLLKVIQMHK